MGEALEKLEGIVGGIPEEEVVTLYLFKERPLAERGSVNPMELRRDVDVLPQLVEHLKREGATSGDFRVSVRGPKRGGAQTGYGSATLPITLPGRSEAVPSGSVEAPPSTATAAEPVRGTPTEVDDIAQVIKDRMKARVLQETESLFDDDEEEEDDDEEEEEDEIDDRGPITKLIDNVAASEQTVGLIQMLGARIGNALGEYYENKAALEKQKIEESRAKVAAFARRRRVQTSAQPAAPSSSGVAGPATPARPVIRLRPVRSPASEEPVDQGARDASAGG